MKLTERDLRVGNLVECTHPSGVKEITEVMVINAMSGLITHEHKGVGYDDYVGSLRPIPLNEEWLKRMGFEYTPHGYLHNHKDSYFTLTGNVPENLDYYGGSGGIGAELKYVHQLQNLFHILTGHELEIK